MGTVVAATHLHLGTQVALKFLHVDMAKNNHVVERFMREARASAQLRSDHVCRVHDVDIADGIPFIVMELLPGQDINRILKARGALPAQMAADIVLQACHAIGEAHALGIVHRDLKPGNLFATQRADGTPIVKVLDFGVAKAPEAVNFSLTQTSSVVGSPGYMSPEQLKSSKDVDPRSDIWSLGVVLYELVSRKQPFRGESITELALRVAMDPTPLLQQVLPPGFADVIYRCLEKDPARRFQDVGELALALAPFAGPRGLDLASTVVRMRRGASTAPVASIPAAPSTPTTLRGASGVVEGAAPARRSWKLPAIIGACVGAGVIVAIVATSGGGKTDTSAHVTAPATQPVAAPAPANPPAPVAAPAPPKPAEPPAPAVAAPAPPKPAEPPVPAVAAPEPPKPAPVAAPEPPKPAPVAAPAPPTPSPVAKPALHPVAKPKPVPKPKPKDVGESRI